MSLKEKLRPDALFETFVPQTDLQADVANKMFKLAAGFVNANGILKNAKLITITGSTGRGKSHLFEAFLHVVLDAKIINECSIELMRGKYVDQQIRRNSIGKKLVLVDDLYNSHNSLDAVPKYAIEELMDAILEIYENKTLMLLNVNFPMTGIMQRINQIDLIGRVKSRLSEIGVTNIELDGPDYRKIIKERKSDDDDWLL